MKKHRISKRIFAMLLVICMVFTMMPANVNAASKGDIEAGSMGMSGIQMDDRITWPIEIYDYSNDGMLFEYASYTGNTASWAQLDKNEEYGYIPELNAEYYADYTTDAIKNTQVVKRWFDVCNTAFAQSINSASGLKYFTFTDFAGKETELIDFRDPNSDAVIDLYGRTNNTLGGYVFTNAYGYTFIIDDVNGTIGVGGDATIITSKATYSLDANSDGSYDCNPYYAANVELKPTGNANEYEVVTTVMGNGKDTVSVDSFKWDDGNIVILIHGDNDENRMDRVAAGALKSGDKVTLSKSIDEAVSNGEGLLISVEADENGKKPGTVSSDDVKYATLVYRTDIAAYETKSGNITYTNPIGYSVSDVTQIYAFTSATATDTPAGLVNPEGDGSDFNYWNSIVLECINTTSNTWQVVSADLVQNDNVNKAGWSPIGTNRMVILFRDEAGETGATYKDSYDFFKEYAKVGAQFTLSNSSLETLQGYTNVYGTSLTDVTLSVSVPVEETGEMSAFFRDAGSENINSGVTKEVPLSGATLGSDWRYCVFDLSKVNLDEIQSAGISLGETSLGNNYDLMVSHFALFGSEAEAESYGEKALVNNKHHIQNLYPDNATYSTDFTTSEVAGATTLITDWWKGIHGYTEGNTTNDQYLLSYEAGRQHYSFTGSSKWLYPAIEMIDFNAIDGVSRDKLKYAVLVYRTTDVLNGTEVDLYFRGKSTKNTDGTMTEGGCWYVYDDYAHADTSTWEDADKSGFGTVIYDLTTGFGNIPTDDQKIYSAGIRLTTYGTDAYDDTVGLDANYTFDIRQFAFFDNEEDAKAYAEQIQVYNQYTEVPTSYYNPIYDNLGYGFLMRSSEGLLYNKEGKQLGYKDAATSSYATLEDMIYYMAFDAENSTGNGVDLKNYKFEDYQLLGTLTDGAFTAGLLQGALGDDGNPLYREKAIEYLAELLRTTLTIPEYEGGYFNYDFVRGEKSFAYGDDLDGNGKLDDESIDLATAIRRCLEIDFEQEFDYETNKANVVLGNITDTQNKAKEGKLKGAWADCKDNIETCFDAAYYLLHNLFVEGSYNEIPEDEYNYLTLYKATLDSGKDAYVFDAGLTKADGTTAIEYNKEDKLIDYSGANQKDLYYTSSTTTTTLFPFLPITADNNEEGMTKSPYFADPGVGYDGTYGETYYSRDFNYVIKSHGEFVYHEDDALFFDFEGDDDVYLFINGQLVLDIGGAHSITKENIDVNQYVQAAYETLKTDPGNERAKALALEEGQVCTFDFFYMERHGYGANCRIATNLRVTDPAIHVEKDAYQENIEINYGGVVDEEKAIEYSFAMTNTGNTKLYNISFDDPFIGVRINGTEGLYIDPNMAKHVQDATGGTLEAGELTAIITGYKAVTDGTGNYIDDGNGNMVETEVGSGTHIATENVVTFNNVKDKDGNLVNPDEALKNFMKTLEDGEGGLESGGSDTTETGGGGGLWINSTLVIKGIYYTMTDDNKEADYFNNTVYVTATTMSDANDESCETLQGQASHKVNLPGEPYYYQWAGHEIILTPERLVKDILENADTDEPFNGLVDGLTSSNVSKIEETTVNERPITTSKVTIDDSNNVTINYTDGGTYVFYLKVYYLDNTKSVLVPVVVNVTDVEDSYLVLDYGLSVNLTADSGIFKYDSLTIPGRETDVHIMAIADGDSSPAYNASYGGETGKHVVTFDVDDDNSIKEEDGSFNLTGEGHEYTLTYTPENFMEGVDSIYAAVAVHDHAEDGFTPAGLNQEINIGREVQMFKKVSVLPANVVYYEDDFPAIKYVDENGEELPDAIFNQVSGSKDLTQSPDQNQEYGRDDAYKTNDEKSGNSITQITIKESGQVAYFEFTGTGFELISRTNAFDAAKLVVEVKDANDNTVRDIPVITEFDNGGDEGTDEIYQVPVIRVDDLTYGTYKVYISGMVSRDYTKVDGKYIDPTTGKPTEDGKPAIIPTILYVDGLRIFNPMEAEETEQYYNESENGAIFEEIRELIVGAKAAIGTYQYDNGETTVSYGTITWTENRNNSTQDEALFIGNRVESVNDYMALGPNNEVYMDSDYEGVAALVFYVKPDGIGEHNLQIAARAIDKGLFEGKASTGTYAELQYAVVNDGQIEWKSLADITSATEQYYTIDYTACPYIEGKGYQVAIKVVDGMVSYTSLKYNRIVIEAQSDAFDETTLTYNANGILTDAETGEPTDATRVPAFNVLEDTFASNARYTEVDAGVEQKILYQTRDDADLRLIAYVDDLEKYDSVSFTLTIDGKETKPLVCTTAYEELIAAGNPYSTEDIYGSDGYFVTYTINGYLEKYDGKDVTITVTYKWLDGEYQETKARTETITIE